MGPLMRFLDSLGSTYDWFNFYNNLPELFAAKISFLLFLMSFLVCVIRKQVSTRVCDEKLNTTDFESLP